MGKKKTKSEYNDFLEDTRYQSANTSTNTDNSIRTTLQSTAPLSRTTATNTTTHAHSQPKKPPLTHFLCLPLVTPQTREPLATALHNLRADVATHTPVPPAAVRPVGTLHLTLGVMSLSPAALADAIAQLEALDLAQLLRGVTTRAVADERLETVEQGAGAGVAENGAAVANATLSYALPSSLPPISTSISTSSSTSPFSSTTTSTSTSTSSPSPSTADPAVLSVRLQGLLPMQTREQTSVLYAEPVDASKRLFRFAESVRRAFEDAGAVVQDERGLKLHATVLNTVYAKGGGGRGRVDVRDNKSHTKKSGREKDSWRRFDAAALMDLYQDFVWVDHVRVDRVQICRMGARKILSVETGEVVDEEYEVVAEKWF